MLSRVYIASSVTRTENKIVKASWGPGGQAVCGVSVVVAKKHAQTLLQGTFSIGSGWTSKTTYCRLGTRVCSSSLICVNTLLEIDSFAFAKKRQIHGELQNIRLQIPSLLWTLPWMDGH
ncbi:uncharacterized protein [Triticum aestivum]|uniref:uncharacterized protein isoform X1 n=1 Tax=Triticum aestivum TaxID=4565 RepID=UPI001D016C45|nr:uncharacterized protein LOC123156825 isoform X1 [Triticum aestivum]